MGYMSMRRLSTSKLIAILKQDLTPLKNGGFQLLYAAGDSDRISSGNHAQEQMIVVVYRARQDGIGGCQILNMASWLMSRTAANCSRTC